MPSQLYVDNISGNNQTLNISAGIITATTFSGNATSATRAGIATYADNAGIATYATSAGVSTNVIGGIASVAQLNVSGVTTSVGGFISVANTTPVTIKIENGSLIFSAVGIGSTSFILG